MNIVPFVTAIALFKHLRERKNAHRKHANDKNPIVSVIRDRVMSKDPIKMVIINNVLGGAFLGAKQVFPNAQLIWYNNAEGASYTYRARSEFKSRFPNIKERSKFSAGVFVNADIIYYKLKMFDKAMFYLKEVNLDSWEDKENWKTFEESINSSKNPNFIIEVDFAKQNMSVDDVIEVLTKKSKKLKQFQLDYRILDACELTGQTDQRLYITSFPIIDALWSKRVESFVVNLDPVSQIQDLIITDDKLMKTLVDSSGKFRKVTGNHSLTGKMTASNGYPVQCVKRMQPNPRTRPYLLEDWRLDTKYPILRYFSLGELERFAGLPTGWIQERGNSEIAKALKDSTNMFIAQFLMESFAVSQKRFSIGVYHG